MEQSSGGAQFQWWYTIIIVPIGLFGRWVLGEIAKFLLKRIATLEAELITARADAERHRRESDEELIRLRRELNEAERRRDHLEGQLVSLTMGPRSGGD